MNLASYNLSDEYMDEDGEEEGPMELNTMHCGHFLEVSKDKLSVKYIGNGTHGNDVGSIQANRRCPLDRMLYYFELSVKDPGDRGCIAIGFTEKGVKLGRQPGKNGKYLGAAFKDIKMDAYNGELYPTVGLHSVKERVEVNFGQRPFLFDVECAPRQWDVDPPSQSKVPKSGSGSGSSGGGASGTGVASGQSGASGSGSSSRMIREGDIDSAFAKLNKFFPVVVQDDRPRVDFLLSCQKFVEFVKKGAVDEAVKYARTTLARYRGTSSTQDIHLQDCLALLAYENPAESPVGYLLGVNQREAVADAVNAAVLALGSPDSQMPHSSLEVLLRQLTLCHVRRRLAAGGQGEVFRLHRLLQGGKDGGW
eukprot:jgi/Mesen1/1405/ME000130S00492